MLLQGQNPKWELNAMYEHAMNVLKLCYAEVPIHCKLIAYFMPYNATCYAKAINFNFHLTIGT